MTVIGILALLSALLIFPVISLAIKNIVNNSNAMEPIVFASIMIFIMYYFLIIHR